MADYNNHRIQKFHTTDNGATYSFVTTWGSEVLNYPTAIAVNSVGDVFVVDQGLNLVRKFHSDNGAITNPSNIGTVMAPGIRSSIVQMESQ